MFAVSVRGKLLFRKILMIRTDDTANKHEKNNDMICVLIVPTLNAGKDWGKCVESIKSQSILLQSVFIVDSGSSDETVNIARTAGFDICQIKREEFGHGVTRQMAIEKFPDADVYIFLTQDAILTNEASLEAIVESFLNEEVGMAYGRQLPRVGAGYIEAHARHFNYPMYSSVRSYEDKYNLGVKTVFSSNSFAAYRKNALMSVGGFPLDTIVAEDMWVAAKMLLNNWKLAYCSEAQVYHSHYYSLMQEFQRYFDIGVFNAREPWVRAEYGHAESEGKRFVISELSYLFRKNIFYIPESLLRTCMKLLGYRLGLYERCIHRGIKRILSMHKGYWR